MKNAEKYLGVFLLEREDKNKNNPRLFVLGCFGAP